MSASDCHAQPRAVWSPPAWYMLRDSATWRSEEL